MMYEFRHTDRAVLSAVVRCCLPESAGVRWIPNVRLAGLGVGVDWADDIVVSSGMSSVEVLGSLDGYPLLLTIDEAAEAMRIGRSLAYGLAHQYEESDGRGGCRCSGSGRASGYRVGRWPSSSRLDASSGWPMDPRADPTPTGERSGENVAVIVGAAGSESRRVLGPVAWCALEVLATTPPEDGDGWVVGSSVRLLAGRMGVATNTAQRAVTVLREAGLVASVQRRRGSGEFGSSAYRLTIDPDVLSRQPQAALVASRDQSVQSRRVASKPPVASKPLAEFGQQLVLLRS
jgi:hypothetical protein